MTSPVPGLHEHALLPLRAFLGVTFCFAGLQKLANHGFFDAPNPSSIQAQLAAAARRSPVHALISPLGHIAIAVGVLFALGELAVGVGTLLGLWSRLAAVGGLVLSLLLFLTVSFHSSPYFTGADLVFAFAWTPLLLAGPGAWTLDSLLAVRAQAAAPHAQTRRDALVKGAITAAVAAGALAVAGLTAAVGRLANGGTKTAGGTVIPSATGSTTGQAGPPAPSASGGRFTRPIADASAIPVGQAAQVTDPVSGDPAVVLHPSPSQFLAFDAVCPHAGCTVEYSASANLLVCPCHGSEFNATTGAVELGPAPTGLRVIHVTRGPQDKLYVT